MPAPPLPPALRAARAKRRKSPTIITWPPHTITVGNKDEDGNYYVMADDIPVIYLVSSSSISSWVSLQYDDVADTMLFMENIVNVKSISLTVDGRRPCSS